MDLYRNESAFDSKQDAPQTPEKGFYRKLYDAYIYSRPMRILLTWYQVTGIIGFISVIITLLINVWKLVNGAVLVSLISGGICSFCIWLLYSMVKGIKALKKGHAAGCDYIHKVLTANRVLIYIGYFLIAVFALINGKFLLALLLLLLVIPLYLAQRIIKGLEAAVKCIEMDMFVNSARDYNNPVRLSLFVYIFAGLTVLGAVISALTYNMNSRDFEFSVSAVGFLTTLIPVIPMYLIGRCNSLIKLAHRSGATIEEVEKEAKLYRYSGVALFGSAFAFAMALNHLENLPYYVKYIIHWGLDHYPAFVVCNSAVAFGAFTLFAVGFFMKKRNMLFAIASSVMAALCAFPMIRSLPWQRYMTLELIVSALDTLFYVVLAFFAIRTAYTKKSIPAKLRLVPIAMIGLSLVCYVINNFFPGLLPHLSGERYYYRYWNVENLVVIFGSALVDTAANIFFAFGSGRYEE